MKKSGAAEKKRVRRSSAVVQNGTRDPNSDTPPRVCPLSLSLPNPFLLCPKTALAQMSFGFQFLFLGLIADLGIFDPIITRGVYSLWNFVIFVLCGDKKVMFLINLLWHFFCVETLNSLLVFWKLLMQIRLVFVCVYILYVVMVFFFSNIFF